MEESVKMTAEERAEYEAFKAERDKKRREEERKRARENYAKLVDDEVAASLAQLSFLSEEIKTVKDLSLINI